MRLLDTNVLVSAFFWNGNERRVLLACLEGRHRLVTSPALLAEAERVLGEKFDLPKPEVAAYLGSLTLAADVVSPTVRIQVVAADPADDRVLECAVAGRADGIVTGDRHLLGLRDYAGTAILRASDVLRL